MLHFQFRHLPTILELVKTEGLEEAEAREVEMMDLFTEETMWNQAQSMVQELWREVSECAKNLIIWYAKEAREKFGASDHGYGAISSRARAMWPYQLVTSIYKALQSRYQASFSIETSAMVQEIHVENSDPTPYLVCTSRGNATHAVHATDVYASNSIPGLKGKIFPVHAHMSAQAAEGPSENPSGSRSWTIGKKGYEYITQRSGSLQVRWRNYAR
ncbi:hypothetical protein BDV28DRAFT_146444 [Aspergillus coremiiformis]|uniref:Uncharacterized protein n=1 Tax=Aspergillus coremiiformis TaxID=138285 RepID=A0A5N6ZBW1_9EURO|nr:hypothetical protein BDV28DRAFT_146444 [Aspergillus coremiiformis]